MTVISPMGPRNVSNSTLQSTKPTPTIVPSKSQSPLSDTRAGSPTSKPGASSVDTSTAMLQKRDALFRKLESIDPQVAELHKNNLNDNKGKGLESFTQSFDSFDMQLFDNWGNR